MNVDLSAKKKTGLCFYFGEGSMSRLLCWAVPNVPKILVMGQSVWLLLKEKRKNSRVAHPLLINNIAQISTPRFMCQIG
jgi:hypothetical protein